MLGAQDSGRAPRRGTLRVGDTGGARSDPTDGACHGYGAGRWDRGGAGGSRVMPASRCRHPVPTRRASKGWRNPARPLTTQQPLTPLLHPGIRPQSLEPQDRQGGGLPAKSAFGRALTAGRRHVSMTGVDRAPPPRSTGREAMAVSTQFESQAATRLVRSLAWVIFALMAAASVYTIWIALANFNRIGV